MIRWIVLSVGITLGFRFRLGGNDAIIQPITIQEISDEPNPAGDVVVTTTPSPYVTNMASEYAIKPTLQESLGENEMRVNATSDDLNLCNMLTGQVRIDAGCLRNNKK